MRRPIRAWFVLFSLVWCETKPSSADDYIPRETAITRVAAKTRDAVVSLKAIQDVNNLGTGLIFDKRGFIITNYHVIANARSIEVTLTNGRQTQAKLLTYDSRNDLAVLRITDKGPYHFVSLADSAEPIQGETVIAIGNPYGLSNSLTVGHLGTVQREMKLPNGEVFPNLIQVSANINHGNSGGPLFTVNGELLGITSAIRKDSQGIAFAIPAESVLSIVKRMMPDPLALKSLGLKVEQQKTVLKSASDTTIEQSIVKISHVEANSPAAQAGLKPGARILEIGDGTSQMLRVKRPFDIARAFWDRRFEGKVMLKVDDAGKAREIEMELAYPGVQPSDIEIVRDQLGLWVTPVPASRVRHLNPNYLGGLLVLDVASDSPGAKAKLQPGDVILGLHGRSIVEPANITYFLTCDKPLESSKGYASIVPNNATLECLFMRDGEFGPRTHLYVPRLVTAGGTANPLVHARK